ncbi:MAG TPA: transporter substrate-binding domain-containing protein, partial [Alphaproteobacteria bacterium]
GGELLMQLVSKKADIIFAETGMVNEFTQTHPNTVRQVAGIGPVRYYGESLAVKRGEMELKNMLDISLMQLTNDGIIDRIVDKYRADYKATFYPPSKFFVKK